MDENDENKSNIFSNIRGSIRRSLRLKVHNKLQVFTSYFQLNNYSKQIFFFLKKTAMKGQEDYNLPNLENDLQYMRFISAQRKKKGSNQPKVIYFIHLK